MYQCKGGLERVFRKVFSGFVTDRLESAPSRNPLAFSRRWISLRLISEPPGSCGAWPFSDAGTGAPTAFGWPASPPLPSVP